MTTSLSKAEGKMLKHKVSREFFYVAAALISETLYAEGYTDVEVEQRLRGIFSQEVVVAIMENTENAHTTKQS